MSARFAVTLLFCCVSALTSAAQPLGPDSLTIGVYCSQVFPDITIADIEGFKWPSETGAVVMGSAPESPASKAGLERFDVIVRMAGKKVERPRDIETILADHPPKKKLAVAVFRANFTSTRPQRVKWKRKSFRMTPATLQDFFEANLTGHRDEVTGLNVIKIKGTTNVVNDRTGLVAKVVRDGPKNPSLTLTIKYVADDWLFVKGLIVSTARGKATIKPLSMERDNTNTIWEWCTIVANDRPDCMKAIRLLQSSSNAELLFLGRQYRKEVSLRYDDLLNLRLMVQYYDYLVAKAKAP